MLDQSTDWKLVQGFKEPQGILRVMRDLNDVGSRMLDGGEGAEVRQQREIGSSRGEV